MTAQAPHAPWTPGDELRKARRDAHLEQADLAALVGVVPKTISRWENGIGEPTISQWRLIAKVTKASWLLTGFPLQPLSHTALTIVANRPIAPHRNKRAGTYGRADSVAASRVVPHTQPAPADHRDPRGHHPSAATKLRDAG